MGRKKRSRRTGGPFRRRRRSGNPDPRVPEERSGEPGPPDPIDEDPGSPRRSGRLLSLPGTLLALLATILLVHHGSIGNGFGLQDQTGLVRNTRNLEPDRVIRSFIDAGVSGGSLDILEYRPLIQLVQALNFWLVGLDPRPWHQANLVLHGLVTLGVLVLGLSLFGRWRTNRPEWIPQEDGDWISAGAAFLFAVHPISSTVMNLMWIRSELLLAMLILLLLLSDLAWRRRGDKAWIYVTECLVLLALLVQGSAVVLVPFLLVGDRIFPPPARTRRPHGRLMGLVILYFLLHTMARSGSLPRVAHIPDRLEGTGHLTGLILAPGPLRLPSAASDPVVDLQDPYPLVVVAGFILGLTLASALWRTDPEAAYLGFGCLFFLARTIVVPDPVEPAAEGVLYPVLVPLALLVSLAFYKLLLLTSSPRSGLSLTVLLLVLELGRWTHLRNQIWKDDLALWTALAESSPGSATARLTCGVALKSRGRLEEARGHLTEAVRLDPSDPVGWIHLALLRELEGDRKTPVDLYSRAISAAPDAEKGYYWRALHHARQGRLTEARVDLESALARDPSSTRAQDARDQLLARIERDEREAAAAGPPRLALHPARREAIPMVAPASSRAREAIQGMAHPPGTRIDLWAAEPQLANPVAFTFDSRGRMFVAQTHRYRSSVLDVREYDTLLEDDLACRTVKDRQEMCQRLFGSAVGDLARESDVIRLLEDRDGDGFAESSRLFASGFDDTITGIGAGLLALEDRLIYTCIPDLWSIDLGDETRVLPGDEPSRRVLATGFGVHFGFIGHDLHGPIQGPDGRLYFTIGDRGASITTREGIRLEYPDEGVVFRCEIDGTRLEVVHRGLRNPQELAFDDDDNLFAADNDFDHGDQERLVHVVLGGDSGWRLGYQHPPIGHGQTPWMSEETWKLRSAEGIRPHAYLPPVGLIGTGPAGLAAYPGTGLSPDLRGKFFLCNFTGTHDQSHISSFSLEPVGASFRLVNLETFVAGVQATDLEFGPDGALYFSDWGPGFESEGVGRIYRLSRDTDTVESGEESTTPSILSRGFRHLLPRSLASILDHPDRRVRQGAHLELASRGSRSVSLLAERAGHAAGTRARLHAIRALGIIARSLPAALDPILSLADDADPEVRSRVLDVLGDSRHESAYRILGAHLDDPAPRPRFFAIQGLGRTRRKEAIPALLQVLEQDPVADETTGHAVAHALATIGDDAALRRAGNHPSPRIRMAVLLAAREGSISWIDQFLADEDPTLVAEAARAIHDVPITPALPRLADRIEAPDLPGPPWTRIVGIRAIQACLLLGGPERVRWVANLARDPSVPLQLRTESLHALGSWGHPHPRNRLLGTWRPTGHRDSTHAISAVIQITDSLLDHQDGHAEIQEALIHAMARLRIVSAVPRLARILDDPVRQAPVRIAAFQALRRLDPEGFPSRIPTAIRSDEPSLRLAGLAHVEILPPADAVDLLVALLDHGTLRERQAALSALGSLARTHPRVSDAVDRVIEPLLESLESGSLDPGLELDVIESAGSRARLAARVETYRAGVGNSDPVQSRHHLVAGGDPLRGAYLFHDREDLGCIRCHRISGLGGGSGPDLTDLGTRSSPVQILRSIVDPDAAFVPGFEPSDPGSSSSMPTGLDQAMTDRELRDLIAYLARDR